MCCGSTAQHGKKHGHGGSCGCSGGPAFWSKKKRIRMLENSLKCLNEQTKDIEELLQELKAEQ